MMPHRNVFSKNLEIPKISQPDSLANQNGLYLKGVYFYFINLMFTSGLITELFQPRLTMVNTTGIETADLPLEN